MTISCRQRRTQIRESDSRRRILNDRGELEVKPGDFVQVAIESLEDGFGSTKLSRDRAKRLSAWLDLEAAMNEGRIVSGLVHGRVKGGLTVLMNGTARIPARLAGGYAPDQGHHALRRQGDGVQGHQAGSQAQQRGGFPPRRAGGIHGRRSPGAARQPEGRPGDQRAWSRTSPITARLWIWAESTACCISPTWPGAASSIPSEMVQVGRKSKPRCSSSIRKRTAYPWASSSWATIPGSALAGRYPAGHPHVRQGGQPDRLRLLRRNRTGHRRPGACVRDGLDQQERQPFQGGRTGRRSGSDGAGYRRRQAPHLLGHEAVQAQSLGRVLDELQEGRQGQGRRSSPSPTSAFSSA